MRYAFPVRLFRLIVLWCCAWGLVAPAGPMRAQQVQRQAFTIDDGLPQNSVHAVLQAQDGYLWAATEGGVARFDGVHFQRFGTETDPAFTSNDTCCLAQTADGTLWIGTSDGVVRWSGSGFRRVPTGSVLALQPQADGSLLVLSSRGLQRIAELQATTLPIPQDADVTALGASAGGDGLLASGTALFRVHGTQIVPVGRLPIAPLELLEDAAHRLWLRSAAEVWRISGGEQRHWRIGADLPGSRLFSLQRLGTTVVAGTNLGMVRLPVDAGPAEPIPELTGTAVLAATVDREGDLWFGTDTAGLVVLRPQSVASVPALAAESITSVVQTRADALWAGTRDSGLRQVSGPPSPVPPALRQGLVLSLAPAAADGLWAGTPDGLFHLQGNRWTTSTSADGLPDDFIRSLLADGPDAVWVGTRHGAALWRNNRVERLLTRAEGLPSDIVGTMLRTADGTLWFGTLRGLARLAANASPGQPAQAVPLSGGIAADGVTALVDLPGGTPLVGTRSGMLAFALRGAFHALHVEGLQGEVDALLLDGAGNLWVRNPTGVQRLALADLLRCQPGQPCAPALRTYGTGDGMPSIDTSLDGHPSAWRAADGVLWFATRRGLARIDAAHLLTDRVPPPVVLERVQVDGLSFPPDSTLHLGPGHHRFVFDYAGLSLRAPQQVTYRFKLEGFDRDWIDAGNRRSAEYTNLPAGKYRLLVEARNADGVRSTHPAELQLQLDAPLYRRWWFYLLLLLLLAAVVSAAYRLHLRRVQREFDAVLQERNRIAREIHDTLAQDFVAVSLQLEVTAQLLKAQATEAAQQQIDSTRMLVRDGIQDARESIWALRAGQSAATLPARLRQLVESAPASPAHTLTVTGSYRPLAPSLEKEVLRITKEALGNAVRHAGASQITVDLLYSEDAVVVTVRDDGAGFDVEQGSARKGHYGLRGMHERASAMGGTVSISSESGRGTAVVLRLHT